MTHTETLNFGEPDLADRLAFIFAWQQDLARAIEARNEARTAKAAIMLARHKIRLYQDAGLTAVAL